MKSNDTYNGLAPHVRLLNATALPSGYPNILTGYYPDRAAESFGSSAARLIEAKRHYDPLPLCHSAVGGASLITDVGAIGDRLCVWRVA